MELKNNTRNQHFISQAEQRLNAINPEANKRNQRIYSFSIKDRDNFEIEVDNKKGSLISRTLSFNDLFSFNVKNRETRENFENLFFKHEKNIRENTDSLIKKIAYSNLDVKKELLDIYVLKLLNSFRNPFCITKTLNTIGYMARFNFTDKELRKKCDKVIRGNKPHKKWFCSQFDIGENQYDMWLKVLFFMLNPMPLPDGTEVPILYHIIKQQFELPTNYIFVDICHYTEECPETSCLISDRSYVALHNDHILMFEFNLCSKAFIIYSFHDIEKSPLKDEVSDDIIEIIKKERNSIRLNIIKNDLDRLSLFNRHTLTYSKEKVYASNTKIHGCEVHIKK